MNHRFWLYLAGRTTSALGDGLGSIAMVWLVYDLTGSKLAMGSLYLASLLPQVIFRLFGAPLVDRLNRIRLMASLDTVLFCAYLVPLLLSATGHLAVWHLYLLQVLAGTALALYAPATVAVLPALVDNARLVRANSLLSAFTQGARVTGPVAAGFLLRFFSSETAMALDALTFGLSALSFLLLPATLGAAGGSGRPGYWHQLTDGFRFFRRVPALLVLTLLYGLSYMSAFAIFTMHAPYAQEHLRAGSETAGLLQGFWPLGFLLGSLAVGYIGSTGSRRTWMLTGLTGIGVALAGLGLVTPGFVSLALGLKALEGFSFALFHNTFTAIFQTVVPNAMRGRASSVQLLFAWGGNPLGAVLGGYLAEQMGLAPTFLLMGSLPIAAGLLGFALPLLRSVDGELRPLEEAVS